MKPLNKTEHRLMNYFNNPSRFNPDSRGRVHYQGKREENAAILLEKKGLVKRTPISGSYQHRTMNGDYVWKHCPQGTVEILRNEDDA